MAADHKGAWHLGRVSFHIARNPRSLPPGKFLRLAAGAASFPLSSCSAQRQTYPSRPIYYDRAVAAGAYLIY